MIIDLTRKEGRRMKRNRKITTTAAIDAVKEACDCQELHDEWPSELADQIRDILVEALTRHPRLQGVPRIEIELATADARNKVARLLKGQFNVSKSMLVSDFTTIISERTK